jgi:GPH family glycoside/pentoside/hexuronide:cation symporter
LTFDARDEGDGRGGPDRIPVRTKLAFGFGDFATSTIIIGVNIFLLFFYTQVLGLEGALAGLALGIAVVFDALSDPIVGSISDSWRSRFGRRHPFMWFSVVPLCASFYLLFNPLDGLEGFHLFAWLTTTAILTRTFMTFFSIPHYALGAELSTDYAERTSIMSYGMVVGSLGGIIFLTAAYQLVFTPTPEFSNGLLNRDAYRNLSFLGISTIGLPIIVSAVFTQRAALRIPTPPPTGERFGMTRLLREARQTLGNRNFRVLLGASIATGTLFGVHYTMQLHMLTYFWGLVPSQQNYIVVAGLVATFIVFGLIQQTGLGRMDKKYIAMFFTGLGAFEALVVINLRLLGLFPENGSPILLPLLVMSGMLGFTADNVGSLFARSMMADVIDEQELETGERQEGIFFSASAFASKAVGGLGTLLGGISLSLIGLPSNIEAAAAPADAIFRMGVFMGPIVGLSYLIPIYLYSRYRLDKSRLSEIQATLAIARGTRANDQTEPTRG